MQQQEKRIMGLGISEVILIACYVILTVSGLTFVKMGGLQTFAFNNGKILWEVGIKTIIGLLLYVVSFLLYITILPRFQLSYISPITTGLVYLMVMVVSLLVFKEKLTWIQIAGAAFILTGVLLMNWGK